MPLYEYRCEACGGTEEKLQSFEAPESHDCGTCGQTLGMRRQASVPSFALSGGGWFDSGYAKGGDAKKAEPAAEAPKAGGGCCGGCACHG